MVENPLPTIRKSPTRIEGLDQILQGGLPTGRTTLVIGGPGSDKSLFGLEFLYRSARAGQPGIFISFEERADALRENAATLSWQLGPLEEKGLFYLFEARIMLAPAVLMVAPRPVPLFGALTDEAKLLTALGLKRADFGT